MVRARVVRVTKKKSVGDKTVANVNDKSDKVKPSRLPSDLMTWRTRMTL